MSRFSIRHETRYDYDKPVRFGPHRLLVRPRDSHAIRLTSAHLTLSPPGETRWSLDALGNSVCHYQPEGEANSLSIVSELTLHRYPTPLLTLRDPKSATPMDYAFEDRQLLAPFMTPVSPDSQGVTVWARSHMGPVGEAAMDYLLRLTHLIHDRFEYRARDEEGVQSPAETLRLNAGTCRDYAWLMVEALRHVGYAARFATGYLYSPGLDSSDHAVRGAGATHAWAQVFLPDLGWLEFDPTNGIAESPDLIPVAVARRPDEAAPISGVLRGRPGASQLTVHVDVQLETPAATLRGETTGVDDGRAMEESA